MLKPPNTSPVLRKQAAAVNASHVWTLLQQVWVQPGPVRAKLVAQRFIAGRERLAGTEAQERWPVLVKPQQSILLRWPSLAAITTCLSMLFSLSMRC